MKLIIKQFFFYLMLLGYLNLNAQNTECPVLTYANDLTASTAEFKTLIKEPSNFKAWYILNKESPNLRTNIEEIKLVSKNLDEITKVGYTAWKKVNNAGSFKNIVKYVDNYNVTSTGKIAEIIGENGDVLGTLYKQKKYSTSTLLEYSYKYKTPSGNLKTFNKLEAEITDDFIEFEFNIPDELKGQGLGFTVLDDAIKYYDIKNPNYKGIRGRWEGADPQYIDGMSDNFKTFKDAKLVNKSDEAAAFETWTGKQAQKQGFIKAKVVTHSDNLVLVEFTK